MDKKRISIWTWIIFLFLILWLGYFWYASLVTKQAKTDLDNYQNSHFCQNKSDCRQIFQAQVMESITTRFKHTANTNIRLSKTVIQNVACQLRLKLSNSEIVHVTILIDLDLTKYHFDVPSTNVVTLPNFPVFEDENISTFNFPVNAIIHVEMWNGKPTFVYSKYVNASSNYISNQAMAFPPSNFDPTGSKELDTTGEYAVPTIDNPLIHYDLINEDTNNNLELIFFLFIILFVIQVLSTRR